MIDVTLAGESAAAEAALESTLYVAPSAAASDALLIEQICKRQEQALGLLYDRYSSLLYTIALRVTGDQRIAEEVIQDMFQAVWNTASAFHTDGNVKAWLIGMLRHRAIDAIGARNFRMQTNTVTLNELQYSDTTNEPEHVIIGTLEREQMVRVLAHLPPTQRKVIDLAYYAGCTCAEIAARTGVPLATVKTRLRLGMQKLRSLLPHNAGTDEVQ